MNEDQQLKQLDQFISAHHGLMVITGAGCSAASGIPTYRDKQATWQRSTPIQHQEFIANKSSRQRYWARSFAGWPVVDKAKPNPAHKALAALEQQGAINLLVTQNVDRLHQKAGHQQVIDLHGRLDRVCCIECGASIDRDTMQAKLQLLNPELQITIVATAPDGDADIAENLIAGLNIPACDQCGGIYKPDVVFYGGSVAKTLVSDIYAALTEASGLLVVGSSLMVFSAFRFCRRANEEKIPIAILNDGITRADEMASVKISGNCEALLSRMVDAS